MVARCLFFMDLFLVAFQNDESMKFVGLNRTRGLWISTFLICCFFTYLVVLGNPDTFSTKSIQKAPWHSLGYDVFTLHTRWNHEAVSSLLGESAKYVTIMRDPVDIFESFYTYSDLEELYGVPINKFIENLSDRKFRLNIASQRKYKFVGRNQIVWDFGMKPKDFEKDEMVDKLIEFIETNFDLVMMADRFAESVVLFKNVMCWTEDEISYLKLNARIESKKINLTSEQRQILEKWLAADMKVFRYFEKKFNGLVERFGSKRMENELTQLLNVNEEVKKKCVEKVVTNDELAGDGKWYSDSVFSYKVKNTTTCRLYGIKENKFVNEMQKIQLQRSINE